LLKVSSYPKPYHDANSFRPYWNLAWRFLRVTSLVWRHFQSWLSPTSGSECAPRPATTFHQQRTNEIYFRHSLLLLSHFYRHSLLFLWRHIRHLSCCVFPLKFRLLCVWLGPEWWSDVWRNVTSVRHTRRMVFLNVSAENLKQIFQVKLWWVLKYLNYNICNPSPAFLIQWKPLNVITFKGPIYLRSNSKFHRLVQSFSKFYHFLFGPNNHTKRLYCILDISIRVCSIIIIINHKLYISKRHKSFPEYFRTHKILRCKPIKIYDLSISLSTF